MEEPLATAKKKSIDMVEVNGVFTVETDIPWWRKDRYGWPIEIVRNHPMSAFFRIFFQNIKKLWDIF